MNDTLKIGTLNSCGGDSKTHHLISTIQNHKLNILFLQETHNMTTANIERLERETKMKCFKSPGTQRGRGVLTLVDLECCQNPSLCARDGDGNFVHVKADINGTELNFMNIYAPSQSLARKKLFEQANERMPKYQNIIYGGDYNCIESFNLDSKNKSRQSFEKSNPERQQLKILRENNNFVDSFRHLHPTAQSFTYTGIANYRARLDRIYIHNDLAVKVKSTDIHPVSFSDHELYVVTLRVNDSEERIKWGTGMWKYNSRILDNQDNMTKFREIWNEHKTTKWQYENIGQYWEKSKQLAKKVLISMASEMKRCEDSEEKQLTSELKAEHANPNSCTTKIRELKAQLRSLEEIRMEGAAIRNKVDWATKGEKCTKFFFSLEKRKTNNRQIESLINDQGNELSEKYDVLNFTENFYQKRFTKTEIDPTKMEELINTITRTLTNNENEPLNVPFTMEELENTFRNMKPNKSPGGDGFTPEFYRQTWDLVARDLLDTMNHIFLSSEIPLSMTQGVITLIYKKGDRKMLNNWRPICLLNTDYKAMSRMIAARFDPLLPQLISSDQTCGIRLRNIADSLICLQDTYDYCAQFNRKCAFYALDFFGAFDLCDHTYMLRVLEKINVGSRMLRLLETIMTNMYTSVMVNGARTRYFRITRSTRQGDPCSMFEFLLAAEPLGNLFRGDPNLHPVKLPNQRPKYLISYADDNTVLSTNAGDYGRVKAITDIFCAGSGAQLNDQKTEILLVGPWTENEKRKLPTVNIKSNIKILGTWFGPDAEQQNREHIISKIDTEIENWENMRLSLQGKLLIINVKILSQIYHVIRVTGMSRKLRDGIQKRITKFTWHPRKMCSIAYKTLQNSVDTGGLNFPNLENINAAILVERISKIKRDINCEWRGHLLYRLGLSLRKLDPSYASSLLAHTLKQTTITDTIINAYRTLETKTTDWASENFKSLKLNLHVNSVIPPKPHGTVPKDIWRELQALKDRKAKDTSYLILHDALPIADVLLRRGLKIDEKCRLCNKERETAKHLFSECVMTRDLKLAMESRLNWTQPRTLGEREILFHEFRIKMKRKDHMILVAYKSSIWQTRGLLYYGHIHSPNEIRMKMMELFLSKLK